MKTSSLSTWLLLVLVTPVFAQSDLEPRVHPRQLEFWADEDFPIEYVVDSTVAPRAAGEGATLTLSETLAAVQSGFDVWNALADVTLSARYEGTVAQRNADADDGVNLVTFGDQSFVNDYSPAVLAVAITTSVTEPTVFQGEPKEPGQIIDADIVFNPVLTFSTGSVASVQPKVEAVVTHEAGHVFGFSHGVVETATMYPRLQPGLDAMTLETDDEIVAVMSYPAPGTEAGLTSVSGRVIDGATDQPVFVAAVLAFPVGADEPVAAQFTLTDGRWSMAGLPPGDYEFYVAPLDGGRDVASVTDNYINPYIDQTVTRRFNPEWYVESDSDDDPPGARSAVTLVAGLPVLDVDVVIDVDLVGPTIEAVYPTPNGTDTARPIPYSANFRFRFDERIDDSSLFEEIPEGGLRFRFERLDGLGGALDGQLRLSNDDGRTLFFYPDGILDFDIDYRMTMAPGVRDLAGNETATPIVWDFTVEPQPDLDLAWVAPRFVVPGTIIAIYGEGFEFDREFSPFGVESNIVSFGDSDPIQVPAAVGNLRTILVQVPEGIPTDGSEFTLSVTSERTGQTQSLALTGVEYLDSARASSIESFALNGRARDVAVLPTAAWTLVATESGVDAVAVAAGRPAGTFGAFGDRESVAIDGGVAGIVAAPSGRYAYAISADPEGGGILRKIDVNEENAATFLGTVDEFAFPSELTPTAIALSPSGDEAWITTREGSLEIFELRDFEEDSLQRVWTIEADSLGFDGGTFAPSIAFTRSLFGPRVSALVGANLVRIDPGTRRLEGTVPVAGTLSTVIAAPQGNLVYLTDREGRVHVIPDDRDVVTQVIELDGSLRGIGVSPTGGLGYVADRRNDRISIVDFRDGTASSRTEIGDFEVAEDPIDVVVAPDGQRVFTIGEGPSPTLEVHGIGFGPLVKSASKRWVLPGHVVALGGEGFVTTDESFVPIDNQTAEVEFGGEIVRRGGDNLSATQNTLWFRVPVGAESGSFRVANTNQTAGTSGDAAIPQTQYSNPIEIRVWSEEELEATRRPLVESGRVALGTTFTGASSVVVEPAGRFALVFFADRLLGVDIDPTSPTYRTVIDEVALDERSSVIDMGLAPDGQTYFSGWSLPAVVDSVEVIEFGAVPGSPGFGRAIRSRILPVSFDYGDGAALRATVTPDGGRLGVLYRWGAYFLPLEGPDAFSVSTVIPSIDYGGGPATAPLRFDPTGYTGVHINPPFDGSTFFELDPFSLENETVTGFGAVAPLPTYDQHWAWTPDGLGAFSTTEEPPPEFGGIDGRPKLWAVGVRDPETPEVAWTKSQWYFGPRFFELHPNGRRMFASDSDGWVYLDLTPSFDSSDTLVYEVINSGSAGASYSTREYEWVPSGSELLVLDGTAGDLVFFGFGESTNVSGLQVSSGSNQTGESSEILISPIRVRAVDVFDRPLPGITLDATVIGGDGRIVDASDAEGRIQRFFVTDEDGEISFRWRLGPEPDADGAPPANQIRIRGGDGVETIVTAVSVPSGDEAPIEVSEIVPIDGDDDVSVSSSVRVRFSRPVDPGSVDDASIVLRDVTRGAAVAVDRNVVDGGTTVAIVPLRDVLDFQTEYRIEISADVADATGTALDAPIESTFVTRAPAPPVLLAVSPPAAAVGVPVTLVGNNFAEDPSEILLTLGEQVVVPTSVGYDAVTFVVPYDAESGTLQLVSGGVVAGAEDFVVVRPSDAPIDEIDEQIQLENASSAVAILPDPERRKAYTLNLGAESVTSLSLVDLAPITPEIEVGGRPTAITSGVYGDFVYVARRDPPSLVVIDTWTDEIVESIPLTGAPSQIVTGPNGQRLYVLTGEGTFVEAVDVDPDSDSSGDVVARFSTGQSTTGSSVTPDGGFLYLTTGDGVIVLSLSGEIACDPAAEGGCVVARFSTGQSSTGSSVTPDGNFYFLIDAAGSISMYDISDDITQVESLESIQVASVAVDGLSDATITSDPRYLYVIDRTRDQILAFDYVFASGLARTAAAEEFPLVDLRLVSTIDAGDDPEWIAFDPRDPSVAFVGASGDRTINVFGRTRPDDCESFEVVMGESWDDVSLQSILDEEYGVGAIDVATDYEGYDCASAPVPYWLDDSVDGWILREIGDARRNNILGWYAEDLTGPPVIDGVDDGIVFDGPVGEGESAFVGLPGPTRFGLYLNPNGHDDAINAPEPELFFTNRRYNDVGPDGGGAIHAPDGGDPQVLIFDVSELRGGVPTYVLAWEDIDSGAELVTEYQVGKTDNDFNDLVIEVRANSPVSAVTSAVTLRSQPTGVEVGWTVNGATQIDAVVVERSQSDGGFVEVGRIDHASTRGSWLDATAEAGASYRYRVGIEIGDFRVNSRIESVDHVPVVIRKTELVRAVPNPFNPQTTISYALAKAGRVQMKIYNLAGRLVRDFDLGRQPIGYGEVTWDGRDRRGRTVASAVYLVKLVTPEATDALRVVLLK